MKNKIIEAIKNGLDIKLTNIETTELCYLSNNKVKVYDFETREEYEITKDEFIKKINKLDEKYIDIFEKEKTLIVVYAESNDDPTEIKPITEKHKELINYFIDKLKNIMLCTVYEENNLNAQYFFRIIGEYFEVTVGYINYYNRIEVFAPEIFPNDVFILHNKKEIDNIIKKLLNKYESNNEKLK